MSNPEVRDNEAIFTLATGEKLRVSLREGGLGMFGYRLNVNTDKALVVMPSAGNSIDLMTVNSLQAERDEAKRIVARRNKKAPS